MTQEHPEIPRLTAGQRRFIARWAVLPFLTISATALTVGLKPDTVYQWRKDSSFVRAMDAPRDATIAEIGAEAEALLRENIVPLMQAKIDIALHGTDRERDSAQTWALEHALGKGEAVNKTQLTADVNLNVQGFFEEIEKRWGESQPAHPQTSPDDSSA